MFYGSMVDSTIPCKMQDDTDGLKDYEIGVKDYDLSKIFRR